ncbi:MAG: hypothetical protein O2960_04385 [Verrucomicrobia bacterium]|nr:hypothetical protein [Verrucomicrobiota bacterium]
MSWLNKRKQDLNQAGAQAGEDMGVDQVVEIDLTGADRVKEEIRTN